MEFTELQVSNIVALHVNKRECVEARKGFMRIISYLESMEYLSEVETKHLQEAKESLLVLKDSESYIDKHLRKFLC